MITKILFTLGIASFCKTTITWGCGSRSFCACVMCCWPIFSTRLHSDLGDHSFFSVAYRFISLAMSDKQPLMGGPSAPPPYQAQAGEASLFKKPLTSTLFHSPAPFPFLSQLPLRSRARATAMAGVSRPRGIQWSWHRRGPWRAECSWRSSHQTTWFSRSSRCCFSAGSLALLDS